MKENYKEDTMRKFYITTPIYYINSLPHIGTAYTTIVADVIAKYKRFRGYETFFLTGTDEHGQKVEQAAEKNSKTPKEWADNLASEFKKKWEILGIDYNKFIRTTDEIHEKTVQTFFKKLKEKGDIYKGEYNGWYCVSCETFWTYKDLKDQEGEKKVCPECGRELQETHEENYFFKLSAYEEKLKEYYENNPRFVEPESKKNEMLSIIDQGLEDLSITRKNIKWGISVPDDPEQVIYVWFDALINYISALGWVNNDKTFETFWPADLHLIGKEINRFHSIVWPAMLMALDIPLPKKVFAHGWLTINGDKMSKSKGNVIDPVYLGKKYGNDVLRYFLLRDVQFGKDGDFSENKLINRVNADLANDLGNLLNRTIAMINQNFNGIIPNSSSSEEVDLKLKKLAAETIRSYFDNFDNYNFTEVLEILWNYVRFSNKYIDLTEPWLLAKNDRTKERLGTVLYNLAESLRLISVLLAPIMPETSKEMQMQLGIKEWQNEERFVGFGILESGNKVGERKVLFKRIEKEKENKKKEKKMEETLISIEEFSKIQLKVAKILEAQKIEKSKKLLLLKIDVGEEEPRQLVAGIAQYYSPENLIGKEIIIVANLKPAKLFGYLSQGMLLAAKDGEGLSLLTPSEERKPGASIS
jgi:methionyl-tRNA synthetase